MAHASLSGPIDPPADSDWNPDTFKKMFDLPEDINFDENYVDLPAKQPHEFGKPDKTMKRLVQLELNRFLKRI